jgi:hypothetical protein
VNRYYYDLHIHSCLSPCADNDMTPNNIAGMAALAGLNIVALTDHNSSRNCPAFFAAAKKQGIIPIAGMELTTAEDIHVVCLFEELSAALAFNDEVDQKRIRIPNRTDIFGDQWVTDENDNVISSESDLLPNATELTIDDVPPLVKKYGAVVIGLTMDENGVPADAAGRVKIAEKILNTAAEYGIPKENILIDTIVQPVAFDASTAAVTLDALQQVNEKLGVKTVLGISNSSFGLPKRTVLSAAFLTMALSKGLSAAIVNPLSKTVMNAYLAAGVLCGYDPECEDYIDAVE